MLLLLQIALGIAFLGYLALAFFDLIRGMYYILTGLGLLAIGLLAIGLALKAVAFVLRKIQPAPVPVPAAPRVLNWKVVAP